MIAGWSYGDAFDQARKEGRFAAFDGDSDQQNLQQLKLGRLDVVLGIRETLQLALREAATMASRCRRKRWRPIMPISPSTSMLSSRPC
ncbi:Uncharacterised protein [Chromobacterium violaceum]|uniref:Solute-binding protein family 3/N-terminal domain-containing protein n=1 Tax=Chromobacterium violaceum TaxID=536 RepID=A0A447T4Y1_CHRVL|nr:Uncharacterised protein [Chromobacterium violaceum]